MLTHRGAIHNSVHFRRKLVRNQRKNFINFRVRKEFVPTIHVHADAGSGMTVLFALSMYLEPYVFVFPLHVVAGPPPRWGAMDPALLHRAVEGFKKRFGVTGEAYRYSSSFSFKFPQSGIFLCLFRI